ncbi:MAG TPA: 4Fe-4S dicluster domain-containing protein [Desulfurivibrionaceae bacterium]|nr:4Fe-4S dicluster domain-containing protein [Desulfurivibrionaceae bacterium]
MLFKVFPKTELLALFARLTDRRIVGPVARGLDRQGRPLHDFAAVHDFAELALDYATTVYSPKQWFLPFAEELAAFRLDNREWRRTVDFNPGPPTVYFGLHACDINALLKLDKVLLGGEYPVPHYAAKRRNGFIIGVSCLPGSQCFCRSMGTDQVVQGFDLFLTDLGDQYFAELFTAEAFELLRGLRAREPGAAEHEQYLQWVRRREASFTCHVDTTDLTKILDLEFQAEAWRYWGDKCLSCGSCANVCPTCYCYGVEETVDLDLRGANKTRRLHSCNLIDFAEVAGGHNFRPEPHTRLKYRYYHKHRGFVEAYEESLCVGCGRCGEVCLAEITVPAVIASVRQEGHHG